MATPKKDRADLQRRGPKPKGESVAETTTIRLTDGDKAWLIDRYGSVSAGVHALIRVARLEAK